jgi:hypothetical protein
MAMNGEIFFRRHCEPKVKQSIPPMALSWFNGILKISIIT